MRELRLAVHPSIDPAPRAGGGARAVFPLSRGAFVASVLVHLAGAYAVTRVAFVVDEPPLVAPKAEFVWLSERVVPPLRESPRVIEAPPAPAVVEVPTEAESRERLAEPSPPQQRVATEAAPEVIVPEPAPPASAESEPASVPGPLVEPRIDFDEERRRAAAEVVEERAREDSYLTFSIDDVAPPRPAKEPDKPSIFDGGFGSSPSVGEVGQARTKFGRRVRELCNALTGGFGVALQGSKLFSACGKSDDEPSGLFPEVRPAYLDLLPECAESQPEQPELAAASPFSTVKCRLVQQQLPARGPPR